MGNQHRQIESDENIGTRRVSGVNGRKSRIRTCGLLQILGNNGVGTMWAEWT